MRSAADGFHGLIRQYMGPVLLGGWLARSFMVYLPVNFLFQTSSTVSLKTVASGGASVIICSQKSYKDGDPFVFVDGHLDVLCKPVSSKEALERSVGPSKVAGMKLSGRRVR